MTGSLPPSEKHFLLRLEEILVKALTFLLTIDFALIFVFVAVLVILRYGFNTTIVGGSEATVMMFIYTTALGAAVEIAKGKHIRIDGLIDVLPQALRKWLEAVNLVLVGVLHAMLCYYSISWIKVVGNSENPILHIPEGIVEIAIPIGCFLAVLFCFTRLTALLLSPCANEK